VKGVFRLVLVVASAPLVSGCFYFPTTFGASGGESANASAAQANVRGAIPAIEAYYADNNTYSGVTLATLQEYDYGVKAVRIAMANDQTYCAESTAGGETYSKAGPAADILPGSCPPSAPPPELPEPAQTLREAVQAMENYRLAHGSFTNVTIKDLQVFAGPLEGVTIAHVTPGTYCLEKTVDGTTWIARESGDVGVGAC
jgi:hypothetical protein